MCGICGVFYTDPDRPVDGGLLEGMNETLRHRGPDSAGYYVDSSVGLAMRRLAIVDLETGDQPLSNEDGSIWVICNGEIYNYPQLRPWLEGRGHIFRSRSDVEAILHLYEEYGPNCKELANLIERNWESQAGSGKRVWALLNLEVWLGRYQSYQSILPTEMPSPSGVI